MHILTLIGIEPEQEIKENECFYPSGTSLGPFLLVDYLKLMLNLNEKFIKMKRHFKEFLTFKIIEQRKDFSIHFSFTELVVVGFSTPFLSINQAFKKQF